MAKKKTFRRITTHEYVAELIAELRVETDRASAIIIASYADSLVEGLLKWTLLPARENEDELFDGNGGLATFSARIDLSRRVRLIDDPLARALHLVRRIRNDHAHLPRCPPLTTPATSSRIAELVFPYRGLAAEKTVRELFNELAPKAVDLRVAGVLICWTLVDTHGRFREEGQAPVCELVPEFFRTNNQPRTQS